MKKYEKSWQYFIICQKINFSMKLKKIHFLHKAQYYLALSEIL